MKTKEKGWFSWLTKSGRFESEQLDSDLDAILGGARLERASRMEYPVRGVCLTRCASIADGNVER